jgi:ribosomal protein S3
MGHVVNPISYRLYNVRYWNNNWFVNNFGNFSYLINQDILLNRFCRKILLNHYNSVSVGLIFLNFKVIRSFDSVRLYFYIHDSFLDLLFDSLKREKNFLLVRKRVFRKFFRRYKRWITKNRGVFPLTFKKIKRLKRGLVLRYSKKFLFNFLKNKLLRLFWNNFKLIFTFHLKKFFGEIINPRVYILGISKSNVNSSIISEFFFIRLKQYYTIWEVLKNVNFLFRGLMRRNIIKGYKITCSGRFSRKQRTTYSWKCFGSLGSSSVKARLDYNFKTIALKYSSCTIKVWIRLTQKKIKLFDFIV